MVEIFKDIPGYEGLYEVSNLGRVRTKHISNNGVIFRKPGLTKDGYLRLKLYKNKKYKHFGIHQLVLLAFVGRCPANKEINHRNCNKRCNELNNLEYVSRSKNIRHGYINGLYPRNNIKIAKLTIEKVEKIRALYKTGKYSYRLLAKRYCVNETSIGKIIRNVTWKY